MNIRKTRKVVFTEIFSQTRKLLKLLLLPVAFVLFFTRWALEASVKLTGWG